MKIKLISILVFIVIFGITVSYLNSDYFNQKTKTCQVTGKESVRLQDKNQYRIYTTCGTYAVEDSLTLFRFDSSDLYGKIVQNSNYRIHSGGYRFPLISKYPNIISVELTQ